MIKLNEFGLAVWRHKTDKELFLERDYEWCDRVVTIREHDGRREIVDNVPFSDFDLSDWIPVTVEEFRLVKSNYKEIHDAVTVSREVAEELLGVIDDVAWYLAWHRHESIERTANKLWKRLHDAKDAFGKQAGL